MYGIEYKRLLCDTILCNEVKQVISYDVFINIQIDLDNAMNGDVTQGSYWQ